MKKCPFCAEEVQDDAKICRFCNRSVVPSRYSRRDWIRLGVMIGMIVLAVFFLSDFAGVLALFYHSKSDIAQTVKTSMQDKFTSDSEFKQWNLTVRSVDLIKQGSNKYQGIAHVDYKQSTHDVPIEVSADGTNIMWQAQPGAFLFLYQADLPTQAQPQQLTDDTLASLLIGQSFTISYYGGSMASYPIANISDIKHGKVMQGTAEQGLPEDTTVYPVSVTVSASNGQSAHMAYYFYQDEFGSWKYLERSLDEPRFGTPQQPESTP